MPQPTCSGEIGLCRLPQGYLCEDDHSSSGLRVGLAQYLPDLVGPSYNEPRLTMVDQFITVFGCLDRHLSSKPIRRLLGDIGNSLGFPSELSWAVPLPDAMPWLNEATTHILKEWIRIDDGPEIIGRFNYFSEGNRNRLVFELQHGSIGLDYHSARMKDN